MPKYKKIFTYITLSVFTVNTVLFSFVQASNPLCSIGYSYDKSEGRCICIEKSDYNSGKCTSPGYGITEDGCCIYSCSTCSSTSVYLQRYINLQVELLQIFRDDIREQEEQKLVLRKDGLFGRLIILPKKLYHTIRVAFKSGANSAKEKLRSITAKTVILSKSATTQIKVLPKSLLGKGFNMFGGFAVIFRSKPFVRDWGKMLDIDIALSDVTWDLARDGYWSKTLSKSSLNKLSDLKIKYTKYDANVSAIFDQFDFVGEPRYQDMVFMMKQINSFMITFLSSYAGLDDSSLFLKDSKDFEVNVISTGRIKISFNKEYLQNLFNDYRCAGQGACNNTFLEIKKMFKILPDIKKSFSEFSNIIKEANQNLSDAFSGKKDLKNNTNSNEEEPENDANKYGLTDKQIELLRTVYGVDTSKLTQQQGLSFYTFLNRDAFVNNMKNTISFSIKDTLARDEIVFKKRSENLSLYTEDSPITSDTEGAKSSLESELIDTINFVIQEKKKNKQIILLYDNVSSSAYFYEISEIIKDIINNIIGTKSSDGLIKTLGEICENQCSNKGNKNCYFNTNNTN